MRNIKTIINEESEKLSRDFEVGVNVLSNQTKEWLIALDNAVEFYDFDYDKCRQAARKFKLGDFEEALKTLWGDKLDVDVNNSADGGDTIIKTYTVSDYAVFTEKIIYKNGSVVHTITGKYTSCPTPGYSLGTIISFSGKSDGNLEILDDRLTKKALSDRNTANIYNILFVGCDIHSKFLSKPMLKLKKAL